MSPEGAVATVGPAELQQEYRFQRELGRGGTSVVYLATDRELGREIAIKVIQSPLAADDETLQRFAREARTAALLHHPNIVTVHAVKRLRDGTLALVMQYVPGKTLKQVIREEAPLPYAFIERVLRDMAAALGYAHSRGIVHRDVKPENIFLDESTGAALLSDFGIARTTETGEGLTLAGVALGTPAYMAPEQIDGSELDGRADLYSLGLVAWEMLSGEQPWEGENLYSIVYKQKHEALQSVRSFRPDAPFHLWSTVEKALQKTPQKRYSDAAALLAGLDGARAARPWTRWLAAWKSREPTEPETLAPLHPPLPVPGAAASEAIDSDSATIRFRREATAPPAPSPEPQPEAAGETPQPALADPPLTGVPLPSWRGEVSSAAPFRRRRSAVPQVAAAAGLLLLTGLGATLYAINHRSTPEPEPNHAASADPASAPPAVAAFEAGPAWPEIAPDVPPVDEPATADRDELEPVLESPVGLAEASTPTEESENGSGEGAAGRAGEAANAAGELGDAAGAAPPAERLAVAGRASGLVSLAAGGMHTCSVSAAGEAFCWGGNSTGQVGDGRTGRTPRPARVGEGLRFRDIAAGVNHTCGVTSEGEAVCWGGNQSGQLGDGTTTARTAPMRVSGDRRFSLVRAGRSHSCGLGRQGEVYCWGDNSRGQLGDGTTSGRVSPLRAGSVEFTTIAVGWNHTCAIDRRGQVLCWGANSDGQLGNSSSADHTSPTLIAARQRFAQVAAGAAHTCALAADGAAMCWGRNSNGQLGDGTTIGRHAPVAVAGRMGFTLLTAGSVHTCGLTAGGTAYCWGRNAYGQLGDGTTTDRLEPVLVEGGLRFSSIHASGAHTCGITQQGEQYCWGYNVEGQVGDGTRSHRSRPVRAALPGR
jgi:serine/threonine protein kinase/alpha-tubulin suppressor-like RCC1 family protein